TQPLDRLSSYLESVSGLAPFDLVRIFQHTIATTISHHLVQSIDPVTGRIFWDSALSAAYDLTKPLSLESVAFSLPVYEAGRPQEIFGGLSMVPQSARYAPAYVSSSFIQVTDLSSPSPFPDRLP